MQECPYCQAPGYECHKDGRNANGSQRYHCRWCQRHFTPAARLEKARRREQARTLYAESGMSARATAVQLGIHHRTVLRWMQPRPRS